jgi:Protein-L-isoaspartate(D-aspartate) O-methyltransferase (PCMT)
VRAAFGITALALLATACAAGVDEKELAMRRAQMVEEVAAMAAPTARETGRARLSDRVMGALRKVERHHFDPAVVQSAAYGNQLLPIGKGATKTATAIWLTLRDGGSRLECSAGPSQRASHAGGRNLFTHARHRGQTWRYA